MGLDSYDDMMGMDFGDFDGFLSMDGVKEGLVVAGGAGVGVLGLSYGLSKLSELASSYMPADPKMKTTTMGLAAVAIGITGGAYIASKGYERIGYGVMGAVAGLGVATLLNTWLIPDAYNTFGKPLGVLPEEMGLNGSSPDAALLAQYDQYAMNGLGATGVSTSAPAFQGFADPTVTPERLQGFASPMVQEETLGYQPWLS
jgi:hypothetical protein